MKTKEDLVDVMFKQAPGRWKTKDECLKEYDDFSKDYTGYVKDIRGTIHQVNSFYAFQVCKTQGAIVVSDKEKSIDKKEIKSSRKKSKIIDIEKEIEQNDNTEV